MSLHGDARGRLGGREVRYAAELADLLNKSKLLPRPTPGADWPTFAGSPERNAIAPEVIDVAAVQWRAKFAQPVAERAGAQPVAADATTAPPAFYPLFNHGRVLVADENEVFGFCADSGRPAWGDSGPSIFREVEDAPATLTGPDPIFGTPRYTLTIADGRLYARLGTPVTSPVQQTGPISSSGSIVCLDLRAEGKLSLCRRGPRRLHVR